jgi:hypothetical protein
MPALRGYNKIVVQQRNKQTACIPASIEWLLRFRDIKICSWDNFQESVDCGDNSNFSSVTQKVEDVYGYSKQNFKSQEFSAQDKCNKIKELIDSGKGCIVSISNGPNRGWHITPVIEYDNQKLVILDLAKPIRCQRVEYSWQTIINNHNTYAGGKDILWLL